MIALGAAFRYLQGLEEQASSLHINSVRSACSFPCTKSLTKQFDLYDEIKIFANLNIAIKQCQSN